MKKYHKKKFMCVLFTFTFETAKWITLYRSKKNKIQNQGVR